MGLKSKKGDSQNQAEEEAKLRDADFSDLEGIDLAANGNDDAAVVSGPKESGSDDTAKLRAELAETKDKYLRSLAEFENFRKRTMKERSELLKYQGEPVIVDLLDVLDSFERAIEHAGADLEKFKEGIKLIQKQFADALGKWEVRADSAIGKDFDPNRQRAIGKAKVPGTKANTVIGELKKSYMYKDRLIRVGEVMVSEGEPDSQEGTSGAAAEGDEAKPSGE